MAGEDFSRLTLEQLHQLLHDIGPNPNLLRAINIGSLREQLPGLDYPTAQHLVLGDREVWFEGGEYPVVDLLEVLLSQRRLTTVEATSVRATLSDAGRKTWDRAWSRYVHGPAFRELQADLEHVAGAACRDQSTDGEPDGEQALNAAREAAEEIPGGDAALKWLEAYGIDSPFEYARLVDAITIVVKTHPKKKRTDWLMAKALRLLEQARATGDRCMPTELIRWKETKQQIRSGKVKPNVILTAPDGRKIYGDGRSCVLDKDGNPRRAMPTPFGLPIPESEVPSPEEIRQAMARRFNHHRTGTGWHGRG